MVTLQAPHGSTCPLRIFPFTMAGRPRGRVNLVPQNEILPMNGLVDVRLKYLDIAVATQTVQSTLEWCARHRLLMNEYECGQCHVLCTLVKCSRLVDQFTWHCHQCKRTKTVRDGSFFQRSHVGIDKIVHFMYGWATDWPLHVIAHETELSKVTAVDWANFCRDVCSQ